MRQTMSFELFCWGRGLKYCFCGCRYTRIKPLNDLSTSLDTPLRAESSAVFLLAPGDFKIVSVRPMLR